MSLPPASFLMAAVRQASLLSPEQTAQAEALAATFSTAAALAVELAKRGWLTAYQAAELCEGRGQALALGPYVLLERLGAGGMGEVFRARHKVLKREVALKRIVTNRLGSPKAVARFQREAEAAARLSHPNVVQIHDAGEAGGVHYLAMELLGGVNLADHLERRGGGPLPVAEAVEYVRQACVGMQHLHQKGLVHRDLKPANLMLCSGGQMVKILDLGLALIADAGTLTQEGGTFGTVDYLAPEQVADSHDVDVRADVYSLGCTLYHLLAGKTPFHDAHPAARPMMHQNQEPVPVEQRRPEVPQRVAEVVRKMMAKKPEHRYQTPGEAAQALGTLLKRRGEKKHDDRTEPAAPRTQPLPPPLPQPPKPSGVSDRPTVALPPEQRPAKWKASSLLVWLMGAALALVLVCVGVLVVVPPFRAEKKDKPPLDDPKLPDTFTIRVGKQEMTFVRVKAGKFTMGSPADEKERKADEQQHEVTITKDFWLGVHEVTQGQYRAVMGKNPSYFCKDGGGAAQVKGLDTDNFPVETVSWQDAQDFLDTLNARPEEKRKGRKYRLPTEAEWEYSCRNSGMYKTFHFGDSLSSKQANFEGNFPYGGVGKDVYLQRTEKVGLYPANSFGLRDMHGNVWEWCHDWYDSTYYANSERRDPSGPLKGSYRVNRGGSWGNNGQRCRSAYRFRDSPEYRSGNLGFRVALVPAE